MASQRLESLFFAHVRLRKARFGYSVRREADVTFELSGRRRQRAKPVRFKITQCVVRDWWPDVEASLKGLGLTLNASRLVL